MGILAGTSCKKKKNDPPDPTSYVTITQKTTYWEVHIDYTSGDRYTIGREYATKCLSVMADFEEGCDGYLALVAGLIQHYDSSITPEVLIQRSLEIYKNIQPRYKDEIEGFASVMSGGTVNIPGDGKLSRDEILMLNFNPDVCTFTGCSAIGVSGNRSVTGQTIVGRNVDWFPVLEKKGLNANMDSLPTNALIYRKTGAKQVLSLSNLGLIGVATGLSSDGIFAANLYSEIGCPYSAVGKRSVMLDIREALETYSTVDEVGAFLGDPSRIYAYHNNMFIADKHVAKVLENDYERNRELRVSDSELNPGITWGVSDAIACVNSFELKGNFDNHTTNPYETGRWANFKTLLEQGTNPVNIDRVRTIMSYHKGGTWDYGDIYNPGTIQSMVYSFSDNRLELWNGAFVDAPQYEQILIQF